MQSTENVELFIYRMKDAGLEVFLVNPETEHSTWSSVLAGEAVQARIREGNFIQLEPVTGADGATRQAIAIEADWHEIPSLRALIYEDYRVAKEKAKQHLHRLLELEQGAYFAVKEAIKKVLPEQYQFLKELKDVLLEKNQAAYV